MKKEEFKNQIQEDTFKYLAEKMSEAMLNEIPLEEELSKSISFSEDFNEKMEKLFKQERKKEFLKKLSSVSKRVAIFAVIIIFAISIVAFSVEAFRVKIFNFFIDVKKEYTTFKKDEVNLEDNNTNPVKARILIGSYLLDYIPEGFELVESSSNAMMTRAKFSNNNLTINLRIAPENLSISLDTEDTKNEKIDIDGKKCNYIERQNENYLLWYDNDKVVTLSGNITKEELIKIVQEIKKN